MSKLDDILTETASIIATGAAFGRWERKVDTKQQIKALMLEVAAPYLSAGRPAKKFKEDVEAL